jgi:hypothetical protein
MARFKTRARAVDMLGRQQIAGIPTAISELFKNAHDAYADHVEVDYYRSDKLLVLRDDGFGMTQRDFEERWLTLGTESKVASSSDSSAAERPPNRAPRPTMGEKGIGRLSIAAIGPQVFVLTRAERRDGLHDTVASFIHWGVFEIPGIDIEDIEIPVVTLPGGTLPDRTEVRQLVSRVRQNVAALESRTESARFSEIMAGLDRFDIDPRAANQYLPHADRLSLTESGHGTQFFIMPADESLEAEIDGRGGQDEASRLTKMLIGFTNTMTPDHPPPAIHAAFRDHKGTDLVDDLIDDQEFFTPDEFLNADHQFRGEFDEYGQFKGTVTIYGEVFEHIVPWQGARGTATECGPFRVDIAYVQGVQKQSTLPPQDYARMINKLDRIGGLYIYRDGIRVLPYGNNDYDFLNIEERRTRSASYYYFSYRRMLGLVSIDKANNASLVEKAGREGFRENKAYRQFKAILENFFVQLAADFFRVDAPTDRYQQVRVELEQQTKLREKRELQARARRESFAQELDSFFERLDAAEPQRDAAKLVEDVAAELEAALRISDERLAAQEVLRLEPRAHERMKRLAESYRITPSSRRTDEAAGA